MLVKNDTTVSLEKVDNTKRVLLTRNTISSQEITYIDCNLNNNNTFPLKKIDNTPRILLLGANVSSQENSWVD